MSLYDTLGVNKDASQKDIKQAYRDKAKENHEDKGGDNDTMTEINRAYGVLRDPVKRDRYDRTGEETENSFEFKFQQYVQQMFMAIVDQSNVDYTDLISEFKHHTADQGEELSKRLKGAKLRVGRLEKVAKRLTAKGENRILMVVENNIHSIKQEIETIKEGITFMANCLSALEDYSYEVDESEPVVWNFNTGGFDNRQ